MSVSPRVMIAAMLIAGLVTGCRGGGVEGAVADSPVADALGLEYDPLRASRSNPGALGEQIIEETRRQEEAIASCMREAGFEYVPFVPDSSSQLRLMDDELRFDSREWYAKYGFFLTTAAFPQSAVGPDLVGYDDGGVNDLGRGPNREIFDALSPEEQDAYRLALHGDLPVVDGRGGTWKETADPGGCYGQVLNDPELSSRTMFFQEFADELVDLELRMISDPRVVVLEGEVAACVESEGYEYLARREIVTGNHPWAAELAGIRQSDSALAAGEYDASEIEAMTDGQQMEFFAGADEELSASSKEILGRLQAEETALAVVTFDCGGLGEEVSDLLDEILIGLEEGFIDEHGERMASLGE